MDDSDWLVFWYSALSSEYGVIVEVTDIALAKAKLYRARANAADPNLMSIQIRTSPNDPRTELWLVRGNENGSKG